MTARTEVVPESSAMTDRPPVGLYATSTLLSSWRVTVIGDLSLRMPPPSIRSEAHRAALALFHAQARPAPTDSMPPPSIRSEAHRAALALFHAQAHPAPTDSYLPARRDNWSVYEQFSRAKGMCPLSDYERRLSRGGSGSGDACPHPYTRDSSTALISRTAKAPSRRI